MGKLVLWLLLWFPIPTPTPVSNSSSRRSLNPSLFESDTYQNWNPLFRQCHLVSHKTSFSHNSKSFFFLIYLIQKQFWWEMSALWKTQWLKSIANSHKNNDGHLLIASQWKVTIQDDMRTHCFMPPSGRVTIKFWSESPCFKENFNPVSSVC